MYPLSRWFTYLWYSVTYNSDQMPRTALHEIFHNYNAGHRGAGTIMSESVIFGGWILHSDTNYAVNSYIDHYDGPP